LKPDTLAALDLGSNSFHLQIARVLDDQVYMLDSLREPVRLGGGLTRDRRIDRRTRARAMAALERFAERLRGFPRGSVRAVGTSALRTAKNAAAFIAQAEKILGFPVEVIFGREEARLIYLGVAHELAASDERRLVVDIGGGSTECIIGKGLEPQLMESLAMGCVSYSLRFFAGGRLDKTRFERAELAAANELQRIVDAYRAAGWSHAVASSGTARALASMLRESGLAEHGISASALGELRGRFIKAGRIGRVKLPGLRDDRKPIIAGGLAILTSVLAEFGIERLDVSDAALRQGVMYDLLGRVRHRDMREATVRQFMRRYQVDAAQAERVGALAQSILPGVDATAPEGDAALLRWAASLHEIGISIAHAGYHKHSAYIVSQADMPGFSQSEQARLARLVLAHRGKMSKLREIPKRSPEWPLIFALRLAALLHMSRRDIELPVLECRRSPRGFVVSLPRAWLEKHPLTEAALEAEAAEWRPLGLRITVRALARSVPQRMAA
jgi:exopolyphosphatase / guanosine-5'-triphosphate,3'-diphosphate pyrophosphatase